MTADGHGHPLARHAIVAQLDRTQLLGVYYILRLQIHRVAYSVIAYELPR